VSIIKEITVRVKCVVNGYFIRWYKNGWHYWYFKSGGENFNTKGEVYKTIGYTSLSVGDIVTKTELTSIRGILSAKYIELHTSDGWKPATLNDETLQIGQQNLNGASVSFTINIWLKGAALSPVIPVSQSDIFEWINDKGNPIINHDGIRMIFKRIA